MNNGLILWADDEIDLLKPHILFLKQKGYDVVTVSNGRDALDAAAMETSDVDKAVSIDWDSTIRNLLSGNAELSYCLISL